MLTRDHVPQYNNVQICPNGRVPCLVDHEAGDLAVWESGAPRNERPLLHVQHGQCACHLPATSCTPGASARMAPHSLQLLTPAQLPGLSGPGRCAQAPSWCTWRRSTARARSCCPQSPGCARRRSPGCSSRWPAWGPCRRALDSLLVPRCCGLCEQQAVPSASAHLACNAPAVRLATDSPCAAQGPGRLSAQVWLRRGRPTGLPSLRRSRMPTE